LSESKNVGLEHSKCISTYEDKQTSPEIWKSSTSNVFQPWIKEPFWADGCLEFCSLG